jgi:hypothetical protein
MQQCCNYIKALQKKCDETSMDIFTSPLAKRKIRSCLEELNEVHNKFDNALRKSVDALWNGVKPKIKALLDPFCSETAPLR